MDRQHIAANPFALLMNPEAVHAALAQSTRLNGLKSQIWRPLDQPILPRTGSAESEYSEDIDTTDDDAAAGHYTGQDLS